jgi:nucleoid-associated protein YgaU
VVEKGETLWSIAEKYYGTGFAWEELAKANNLTTSSPIEVGQTLTIPAVTPKAVASATGPEGQILATATETPAATATVAPSTMPSDAPSATPEPTKAPEAPTATIAPTTTIAPTATPAVASTSEGAKGMAGKSYTVVHGDSLWKIAVAAYGDGYKWSEIARTNKLVHPDVIHAGNVLQLP